MQPLDLSGKRLVRPDDSNGTRSSTDDVHSMCSQLSNLGPRSLPNARSLGSSTSSILLLHKTYKETSAPPPNQVAFKSVILANTQLVTEFLQNGELPTFKKQSSRSTNNPWRRYGALRKICETGGFAPNSGSKKERKNRETLMAVKQNVKVPIAPTSAQMTLNKVKDPGPYENKLALKVPKNTTVDVAAQNLAEQVKIFILQYGVELVDNEPEINQGVKSK
ncbi:Ras-associating domain-containing protein [Caenorhabditis elegans]|uniref:Ras-associating domain-containing protein n=1 Tax=Caenorhabditis elegans TaxID=6239 RepID=Q21953_CAEEL|nr:Ras-associating domain-containing protein [Caenorhabditis elegans]CCD73321.1 Ras-associating domain-containing protein [Caenorhabditis elegans]|eukprot:NP_498254.3 Uncharacterized protein CELE_R12B2.3 [Caenorhabditis elegans]